jgi:hypothetical protein
MAVYGEPLSRRHGVGLYSAQTTLGTAVTPATTIGPATFGHTKRSNNTSFRGPGSPNRYAVKGGMTITEWEISWDGITSGVKTLLQKSTRTAGLLPLITLGFGYKDDAGTPAKSADQIQDCKVGSLELSYEAGNDHSPISGSISGIGGLITELTTLNPALDTSTPFMTYEALALLDGAAYEMVSFNVNIDHNLNPKTAIRGAAAASFPRGPKYYLEGDEVITGSITRYRRMTVNPFADCPSATGDLSIALTNVCDATTLTLNLVNLSYDNERFQGEDDLLWSADFEADTFSIS